MSKFNEFRKGTNMTIEEFAGKLNYSISYIEKLCYADRRPSGAVLERIKRVFPEADLNFFYSEIAQNVRN